MKSALLLIAFVLIGTFAYADKKITVSVTPANASIYKIEPGGKEILIGTGTAQIKVDKSAPEKIVVRLEGYKPIYKTYINSKTVNLPKEDKILLEDRLVKLNIQPYDARVFINGVDQGSNNVNVEIKKDATVTVEVKKIGFFTKTVTYYNRPGMDVPPASEFIILSDRAMLVRTSPTDVQVLVNGKKVGEGVTEVVIPVQQCVNVEYVREGFVTIEKQYCAEDGQPAPPFTENIVLKDRQVSVRTTPEDASIRIDGRVLGSGEYKTRIPFNQCVELIVAKPGFVSVKKSYCNEDGVQPPPLAEHIVLKTDEAFSSSIQSDQANVNFTIETRKAEEEAWKIISQITMNYFDNIELADRETGYIRTSWNVKNFENNTIRTRIIVKQADISPLKYTVKLVSETSGEAQTSVKNDENFKSWDRLLNTYKDVVSEYSSRLR
jgi:hypothetical protein